ncbi:hypothetical protein L2K70_00350 [Nocardioides KLBMP 9356]|uniref:Uncharacterized protein n=1 Tax=Nocardioides potassii TaxID=2911371 RepID=A0ABS9H6I7_9ACTN|nr:hypothetical protein [Nocardioides potassii]MCF6376049.1 hypothetical protein [Nocardioides potassii]
MSLLDRLLGRSSDPPPPAADPPPVDDGLEQWVVTALQACADLGPAGRLVVAVLGESLADPPSSPWFGHEPTASGLADLLGALGEDPARTEPLLAAEAGLAGRRLGVLSDSTRESWRATVQAVLRDPAAIAALPERDQRHREAEQVWRTAAARVQPWRAVQLDPDRALGQVRWYPGCDTRTFIGYSDPLGLAAVQRSVQEHRFSDEEWQALVPVEELHRHAVHPLAWRLSSLAFAARGGPRG